MATIQTINIGAAANDNTGDPLRTAFDKQNQNNTALNNDLASKAPLANASFTTDIVVNQVRVGKGGGGLVANTVVGFSSGQSGTTGQSNTYFGNNSGYFNQFGNSNTCLGASAGYNNISDDNTFVGSGAGIVNTNGTKNTYLGKNSGSTVNNTNCTALGNTSTITGDNQVQLGNASTTTYVYGTVQNRSDLRDKADVQDTVLGLDFISKLRPVDYKWDMREDYKDEFPIQGELSDEDFKIEMDLWLENGKLSNLKQDGSKKRNRFHHGFIAQEVRDLGIEFGGFQDHAKNGGEDVLSIGYDEFIAPMIKAIQELKAEIELLKMK